jgi:hypothetical protein
MENKYEVSDEEILGYMRQGWRFHRKRVKKKYEYIIRRRRTIERSRGSFNEGFWERARINETFLFRIKYFTIF